jgi:sphingomyelin phosphodiesterase acid-like 3
VEFDSVNHRSLVCLLHAVGAFCLATFIALVPFAGSAETAHSVAGQAAPTVYAILVSDIHFDPFADPSKVKQLADAPIENWDRILAEPAAGSAQSYNKLLEDCGTRGPDTPFTLLKASLLEMKARAPEALFVTVTGDLLAHGFECKLHQTLPADDAKTRADFTARTIAFVARKMRAALPGVPIYFALGNNDSDCGDYRLDVHSRFLSAIAPVLTSDVSPAKRSQAIDDFSTAGYYAVDMPAPIRDARFLIIDDTFMAGRFSTCSGKDDRIGEKLTLDWLSAQLNAAREAHRKVWVMGHIPPGIDLKGSISHGTTSVCGRASKAYLDSETLAEKLTDSGETVKVALFGHTHMDEMRLLTPRASASEPSAGNVAVKIVPSISPINGNSPSFLVAKIDPDTAQIADYKLIEASGSDPAAIHWNESYDYQLTYHENVFSNGAMARLAAAFRADVDAATPPSKAYIHNFMPGTGNELLRSVWPAYTCELSSQDVATFTSCSCPK